MLSNLKHYVHLKRQAMRLMLSGDLGRYMKKLREMQELRARMGRLAI